MVHTIATWHRIALSTLSRHNTSVGTVALWSLRQYPLGKPPSRTRELPGLLRMDTYMSMCGEHSNIQCCVLGTRETMHVTYCWTLQASQRSKARRMFLDAFSAILFASSGGRLKPSFRHVCCKTVHTWRKPNRKSQNGWKQTSTFLAFHELFTHTESTHSSVNIF